MIDNIYLTNFRCIAEADIQLRDGITVLIGNNGVGKSSIIEAITFNLYGKIKNNTKKESIRRSGASEDDITFTSIDFHMNDIYYRCRRGITKKGSTVATLYSYTPEEYEQLLAQKNRILLDKNLGKEIANSTTGVTKEIISLFGISYDGFCASFIAKQKELDSLASLTLENRKKFFLDLLGYSKLDKIKTDISKELRGTESSVNIIKRQSINLDDIAKKLTTITKTLDDVENKIKIGQQAIEKEEKSVEVANNAYNNLFQLSTKVNETTKLLEQENVALKEKEELVSTLTKQIAENKKKSEGYDENSSLSEQLMVVKDRIQKANTYISTKTDYEKQQGTLEETNRAIQKNQKEIDELRKKTEQEPNLDIVQQELAAVNDKISILRHNSDEADKTIRTYSDLLENVRKGEIAKCPTCGSSVASEEGQQHLQQELDSAKQDKEKYQKELAEANEKQKKLKMRIDEIKMSIRTWQVNKNKLAQLERENEVRQGNIKDTKIRKDEIEKFLKEHSSDRLTTEELLNLEEESTKLSEQMTREKEMQTAFYAVRTDEAKLTDANVQIEELKKTIAEHQQFVKEHKKVPDNFEKAKKTKEDKEKRLSAYRQRLDQRRTEQGQYLAQKSALEEDKKHGEKQAKDLAEMLETLEIYTGAKDTIEFLREKLPSKIAPRLSFEASRLLSIATNGRYNMLEIDDDYEVYVYAGNEIRPIALMSGGEQDIISLCIRISIATMILEATGITEHTFILDEIFGALDDERKASACDALQNLGSALSRILCITHIDDIKDRADWTYVVERDENDVSHVREVIDSNKIELVWEETEKETKDAKQQEIESNVASKSENTVKETTTETIQ